jgi:hypothetical protein
MAESGYNFVEFGDRVYALAQAIGPVDIGCESAGLVARFGPDMVIVTDTLEEARAQVAITVLLAPLFERCEKLLHVKDAKIEALSRELITFKDGLNKQDKKVRLLDEALAKRDDEVGQLKLQLQQRRGELGGMAATLPLRKDD